MQTAESKAVEALIVHSDSYRSGNSELYPIGALKWDNNVFRIENKSNELISSNFIITLANIGCNTTLVGQVDSGGQATEIYLPLNYKTDISIPLKVNIHNQFFVNIKILENTLDCTLGNEEFYPVAIYGWTFGER